MMLEPMALPPTLPPKLPETVTQANGEDASLMQAAKALEASFLAEMLKHSGLGQTPEGFGGGVGEDQFSGLLSQIRAEQMVEAGGIGLAERIFEDLKARAAE